MMASGVALRKSDEGGEGQDELDSQGGAIPDVADQAAEVPDQRSLTEVRYPLVFRGSTTRGSPLEALLTEFQRSMADGLEDDRSPNGFERWTFRLPGGADATIGGIWDWGHKRRREMSKYIRVKESGSQTETKEMIRRSIRGYHRGEVPHAGFKRMMETMLRVEAAGRLMQTAKSKRDGNLLYLEGGAGSGLLTKMLGEQTKGQAGIVALEVDENYAEWLRDRSRGEFDIQDANGGDVTHISQLPENAFVAHADLRNLEMPHIDGAFFEFSHHHLSNVAKIEVMRKVAEGLKTAFEQGNIAPYVVLGEEVMGTRRPRTFEEAMEFLDELHGWSYECARRKLLHATRDNPEDIHAINSLKELMDNESASLLDGLQQITALRIAATRLGLGDEWISPVRWEQLKREGQDVPDQDGELKVSIPDLKEMFESVGMEITFLESIAPSEEDGMTIRNRAGVVVIVAQLKEQLASNQIKVDPTAFSASRLKIVL